METESAAMDRGADRRLAVLGGGGGGTEQRAIGPVASTSSVPIDENRPTDVNLPIASSGDKERVSLVASHDVSAVIDLSERKSSRGSKRSHTGKTNFAWKRASSTGNETEKNGEDHARKVNLVSKHRMALQQRITQRHDRYVNNNDNSNSNSNSNSNNNNNNSNNNNNNGSVNNSNKSSRVIGYGSVDTDSDINKIMEDNQPTFYRPNNPFLIPELLPTRVEVCESPFPRQTPSSSSSSGARPKSRNDNFDKGNVERKIQNRLTKLRSRQKDEHQLYTINKW